MNASRPGIVVHVVDGVTLRCDGSGHRFHAACTPREPVQNNDVITCGTRRHNKDSGEGGEDSSGGHFECLGAIDIDSTRSRTAWRGSQTSRKFELIPLANSINKRDP
jgi:hypothetical protein